MINFKDEECAVEKSPSQIEKSGESLRESIGYLNERFSLLKNKLKAVSQPQTPEKSTSCGVTPSVYNVDLALFMNDRKNEIDSIIESVNDAISRLEL